VYHSGLSLSFKTDGFIVIEAKSQFSIPSEYYLYEAYPNPFNNRTVINYGLPESGMVKINLYDVSGRHILDFGSFEKSAGTHNFELNAEGLGSGTFIVSIEVNGYTSNLKIILTK